MQYILKSNNPNRYYEIMMLVTQTYQVKQHYFASSEENVSRGYRLIDLQLL